MVEWRRVIGKDFEVMFKLESHRYRLERPILAEPGGEVSNRVLKRVQKMSEPYDTKIEIKEGMGVISLT